MENQNNAQNYLKEFERIGKKQKIIILIIILSLFFVSFIVPFIFQNHTPEKGKTENISIPTPTLIPLPASAVLTSEKNEYSIGDEFIATLNINSPNQGIEASKFTVNYDPAVLKVNSIDKGNFYKDIIKKDIGTNFVTFAGIADISGKDIVIPKGKGEVAKISFTVVSSVSNTTISIDKNKSVTASNGKNILESVTDLNLKIN